MPPYYYDYDRHPLDGPSRGGGSARRRGSPYPRGPPPDDYDDDDLSDYDYPSSPPRNTGRSPDPSAKHRPRSLPREYRLVPRYHNQHQHHRPPTPPPAVPDPPDILHPHRHPSSPPPTSRPRRRRITRSKSTTKGPIDKARDAVDRTFSQTPSGLGAGLLGAMAGGLAARSINDSTRTRRRRAASSPSPPRWRSTYSPHSSSPRSYPARYHPGRGANDRRSENDDERSRSRSRFAYTAVGAIVGGLGANAMERRFENSRERKRAEQSARERKRHSADRVYDRHYYYDHHPPPPPPPHYHRHPGERTPRWSHQPFEVPEWGTRYRDPAYLYDDDFVYHVPRRRGRASGAVGHEY